jgi:phage terminase Nu1 subunit (DNA packaging protein)
MPTHRDSVRMLSVSQLREATGMAAFTIVKRLRAAGLEPVARDGRTTRYDAQRALPILFVAGDPTAERARFDRVRADAQELRNQQLRGELVPAAGLDRTLIGFATRVTGRLLALPARIAHELAADHTPAGCQKLVYDALEHALQELADAGSEAIRRAAEGERDGDAPP